MFAKILPYFFWAAVIVNTLLIKDPISEKIWNLMYVVLVFAGMYAVLSFLIHAIKE
jgi:hypothetical protein